MNGIAIESSGLRISGYCQVIAGSFFHTDFLYAVRGKTGFVTRFVFYSVRASVIRHSRKLACGSYSSLGGGIIRQLKTSRFFTDTKPILI